MTRSALFRSEGRSNPRMEGPKKIPLMALRNPMVDYGRAERNSLRFILVLGVAALLLIVLFCSSLFLTRQTIP